MSDIVEQLRSYGDDERQHFREARATLGSLLRDAADEITRLRAENERLRAALGDVHAAAKDNHLVAKLARAALEEK